MVFPTTGEKINFLENASRKLYSHLEKDNIKCVPHPVYQTMPWKGLKSKVKNAPGQVLEANRVNSFIIGNGEAFQSMT